MTRFVLLLAFLPAVPAATPSLLAQDTAGVGPLAGVARDGAGRPVADVAVCAVGASRCTVTGTDGTFRLTDLRPGTWQIEIIAPPCASRTCRVGPTRRSTRLSRAPSAGRCWTSRR